ncbi:hypothetical protein ACFQ0T_03235 [Kitasatospora gansuensis]
MVRQVCRSPGRRVSRIECSRTVAASTTSPAAVSRAASRKICCGLSTRSRTAPRAKPSTAVPPEVMFISERAIT